MTRERRLAVMADPTTGAFGVATVAIVVVMRVVALGSIAASPLLLAGLWCASRTWMAVIARSRPYARAGGLASAFLGGRPWIVGVGGAALATGLAVAGGGLLAHRWIAAVAIAASARRPAS